MSEQDLALAGRARKMGIALSTTQSQQFETYRSLLLDWNKKNGSYCYYGRSGDRQ